jgi:hypothetical protein
MKLLQSEVQAAREREFERLETLQDPDNSSRFVIKKEFNVWTVKFNCNWNRDVQ